MILLKPKKLNPDQLAETGPTQEEEDEARKKARETQLIGAQQVQAALEHQKENCRAIRGLEARKLAHPTEKGWGHGGRVKRGWWWRKSFVAGISCWNNALVAPSLSSSMSPSGLLEPCPNRLPAMDLLFHSVQLETDYVSRWDAPKSPSVLHLFQNIPKP